MTTEELLKLAVDAIEEIKAVDVRILDIRTISSITDVMVVASGRSNRQVLAMMRNLVEKAKAAGVRPLGVEGEQSAEWVLVDLGDVVVHLMQPQIREFYQLEKLWTTPAQEQNVTA